MGWQMGKCGETAADADWRRLGALGKTGGGYGASEIVATSMAPAHYAYLCKYPPSLPCAIKIGPDAGQPTTTAWSRQPPTVHGQVQATRWANRGRGLRGSRDLTMQNVLEPELEEGVTLPSVKEYQPEHRLVGRAA